MALESGKHAIPVREAALRSWCAQRGASAEQRALLRAVLRGLRGADLAQELGLAPTELARREREFLLVMRVSVYEAAVDVLSTARRRRSSVFGLDTGTD